MRRGLATALVGLAVVLSAGCTPSRAPAAASAPSATTPSTTTPSPVAPLVTPTPKPSRAPVAPKTVRARPKATEATPTYRSLEKTYLVRNKIYSAGRVPAVTCELPQIELTTRKEVQQYASAVLGCLQRAWKPVVERSDVAFFPAKVYAVNAGSKTRCGILTKELGGFYCSEGSGIYLDWQQFVEDDAHGREWAGVYLQFTIAHEFGHHVQQLVGISPYFDDRWAEATGAARLEQMRRHELQASCFASAFFGANQQTLDLYYAKLQAYLDAARSGDDDPPATTPDHGSRESSTAWAEAAFKAKSPSACNTWAAPAKRVT
ncbi:neutral zinc metallopeptidase [Kribbella kalugense]|uniref:Neutral zinc metallopeptidase n=1 Tax=Kribbella kalugense TaxID=2512221 RepID=A0A4R7ZGT5_9ACTN|nr:neutral zinc metallopeptidase [Kribbella kalugense]TDW15478.1 hypothetical protein EV650_6960 [Kribbella kalugense]